MKYAIYLSSSDKYNDFSNAYGYWTGKSYIHQGETFPRHTGREITNRTKLYQSKRVAENAIEKCVEKYSYVIYAEVKEVLQ